MDHYLRHVAATAQAGGSGRRARRKALTRRELILAGRKLFSERGLYESRIEDLTRQAGIAKGTLYQYFRDKDELIQEVVAMGFADLGDRIDRSVAGAKSLPTAADKLAAAHFEFFAENPDLMRIFHQVRGLLKFDRRRWRSLRVTLRRHLERIANLMGTIPSPAPLSAARRLELAILIFGAASGISSVNASVRPQTRTGPASPVALSRWIAAMAAASIAGTVARRRRAAAPKTARLPLVRGGRPLATPPPGGGR